MLLYPVMVNYRGSHEEYSPGKVPPYPSESISEGNVYRFNPLLCAPYSMASFGQRQMQAMQCVQ